MADLVTTAKDPYIVIANKIYEDYQTRNRATIVALQRAEQIKGKISASSAESLDTTPAGLSSMQLPSLDDILLECRPFHFMELPVEVRIMIYQELFSMPGFICPALYFPKKTMLCIRQPDGTFIAKKFDPKSFLGVFLASKTIHGEAGPVLFRNNDFLLDGLNDLETFLAYLRPDYRRNLTSIRLQYWGGAPAQAMKMLSECIGLRRLSIDFTERSTVCMSYARPFLMKLWGLNGLLKIRGLEKLELGVIMRNGENSRKYMDQLPEFEAALQVLKKPHPVARLTRQAKKDYPQKATRTVFGKANGT